MSYLIFTGVILIFPITSHSRLILYGLWRSSMIVYIARYILAIRYFVTIHLN